MPQPTTYPKRLSVIVSPALLKKFSKRCQKDHVVGQAVMRSLAELYLAGHVDLGANCPLPAKPYKAWMTFKCDRLLYERVLRKSREVGIPAAAIVRRLVQSFVERTLPERFERFVRDASPVVPGIGGRGWKVRRREAAAAQA